jgi:hypothetical protein
VLVVDINGHDLLKDADAYARLLRMITQERGFGHHVERL